jgi:hypothetical protein
VKKIIKKWLIPPGVLSALNEACSLLRRPGILTVEQQKKVQETDAARGVHEGQDCFIVGAGSSIKKQDLSLLIGRNCITVSNVYVHPEIMSIIPLYHVLPNIFQSHAHLYGEEKYIIWLRDMHGKLPLATKMIMDIKDKEFVDTYGLFSGRDISWCGYAGWDESKIEILDCKALPRIWSVSETAIMMAIFLGFERIFLLGFDHDWFNGIFNYFYDKATEHKVGLDMSKVSFADSEFQMRRHAYIFKKYKELLRLHGEIFNCNYNQDTYVDIFPKMTLEQALSK